MWLLLHAFFPFPSYMAFVSCRFSLPTIHGFCFMPFFPSHQTWLLFHAILLHHHIWLVSCRFSLPIIHGFCFMPFFPSLYTWLLFHAVFPYHHIWLLFHA